MSAMTDVNIPTTDTVPKDIPDASRPDMPFPSDPNTVLLTCLLILCMLFAAYVAAEVLLPIVFAFVVKMLLQPGMRLLDRIYVPRAISALFLMIALFGVIFALGAAVSGPASAWAQRLPEGLPRLQERLRFLSEPIKTVQSFLKNIDGLGQAAGTEAAPFNLAEMLFRGTSHFASGLFEMLLILFFLLVSGDTFLRRMVELLPRFKDKRQVVDISQQVERNVSAYLVTVTVMNAMVGLATAAAMWACGLGDPLLWGVVAFLLNYVPIMGPFAGIGLFLIAGMLSIDSFWWAFVPAGLYFAIHVVEGEFVTPMLLARRFTLNPVMVIISLIFWFWMWGVPGAILSVPMLAIMKIVCDGVKPLNPIGHFLEGDA